MNLMEMTEVIIARGHNNIQATHKTTLEITKEAHLTKKGACIIAVSADKAGNDLSLRFKESLRKQNARLIILIKAGEATGVVNAWGSPQLTLTDSTDMVIRKSNYICDRTLAINADKAACDLPRDLVKELKDPKQKAEITLSVKV
jgi:hypothetical protein